MGYRDFWGLTVHGMLARLAERYGDRPLFTWRRGGAIHAVTYGEFFRDVRRLAARLAALGLQGKSVVIDMRNSYEQVAALFAASSMGAVAAPLSFDLPLEDLRDLIGHIGPELLICDELDLELVPELQLPEGCALLPCLEGADSAAGVLAGDGPLCQEREGISPDDPALLLATSGSTSRSKLVLLSHYGLTPHWELMRCGRVLHVLPLHHVAALWCLSAYMALGSEICLSDLGRGAADLAWFRPTDLFAVPAFVSLLVRQSRTGRLDLSGLRSISSGGAPQNLETVAYLNSLGIFSMSLYGATETAGAVDYSAPAHYRFGSVGRVGPWNQVRFSSRGEILVDGKRIDQISRHSLRNHQQSGEKRGGDRDFFRGKAVAEPSEHDSGENTGDGGSGTDDSGPERGPFRSVNQFHLNRHKGIVEFSDKSQKDEKEKNRPDHMSEAGKEPPRREGEFPFFRSRGNGNPRMRNEVILHKEEDNQSGRKQHCRSREEGRSVSEMVHHDSADHIADHVPAPEGGTQRAQCESLMLFRRRAPDQSLRGIDCAGKNRHHEPHQHQIKDVRNIRHQRKQKRCDQIGSQQHHPSAETVRERSPDRHGYAETQLTAEIKRGDPESAFPVVHHAEHIAHVERNKRNDRSESRKRENLGEPDKKEIPFPVDHPFPFVLIGIIYPGEGWFSSWKSGRKMKIRQ